MHVEDVDRVPCLLISPSDVAEEPGESFVWSADGGALLREHAVDEYVSVLVHDDIRRDYRDDGTLLKLLAKWKKEDDAKAAPASSKSPGQPATQS